MRRTPWRKPTRRAFNTALRHATYREGIDIARAYSRARAAKTSRKNHALRMAWMRQITMRIQDGAIVP